MATQWFMASLHCCVAWAAHSCVVGSEGCRPAAPACRPSPAPPRSCATLRPLLLARFPLSSNPIAPLSRPTLSSYTRTNA
jgi:hypothetical protein